MQFGLSKAHLSTTKKAQKENKDEIAKYTKEIEAIQKYRKRIAVIEEGKKTENWKGNLHSTKKECL